MKQAKPGIQSKTRKDRMERFTKASMQHPEQPESPVMLLKSWQGVARSGLRPPKHTPKHTGSRRG